MYNPKTPFNTHAVLYLPTTQKINGIEKRTYQPDIEFFCSVKSYGGTEYFKNDLLTVEDTRIIETYYNPKITKECQVQFSDSSDLWEILNTPENIDLKNLFLVFKVRRIKGA